MLLKKNMKIALYQPDIPQNTGNIIRLAACFNITVHIIGPAGFFLDDKNLKRSAMDYYNHISLKKHIDWERFYKWSKKNNLNIILFTTKSKKNYLTYKFKKNDILLFGRESSGVPKEIHKIVDERLTIKMKKGLRSLNISSAAAMAIGENNRQLNKK